MDTSSSVTQSRRDRASSSNTLERGDQHRSDADAGNTLEVEEVQQAVKVVLRHIGKGDRGAVCRADEPSVFGVFKEQSPEEIRVMFEEMAMDPVETLLNLWVA